MRKKRKKNQQSSKFGLYLNYEPMNISLAYVKQTKKKGD